MPPRERPVGVVSLVSARAADVDELRDLAGRIWREHYPGIIPPAQIEFMLAARFSDEAVERLLATAGTWLDLLRVAAEAVGYCGCELGHGADAESLKLGQLYLLAAHRGRGLGRLMLGHVEARARALGRTRLVLQVNRRNIDAIGFYERHGFTIREAAVFEIGGGFVMDDYVMEKRLPG